MKTKLIKHAQTDLEARVLHECDIAIEHCKISGASDGSINQPLLNSRRIAAFVEENRLQFQAIIDRINNELLFKSTYDNVVQHKAATEKRLRYNHQKLVAAKEKRVAADAAIKRQQPAHTRGRMIAVWTATGVITLFEGLLSEPIFEGFGYSTIEASVGALLFAGALAATAHILPAAIRIGKNKFQKRLIAGFAIGTLTALFSFMGYHRAAYAEAQMAHEGITNFHVSPITFVLLSWLLFGVATAIHYLYYPSRAEREQQRAYNNAHATKRQCDEACDSLIQEHDAITQAHEEVRSNAAAKMEHGYMLESLVFNRAHEGLAVYKKHNLMNRSDGGRPVSFDEAYTMQFHTNFHTIKDL